MNELVSMSEGRADSLYVHVYVAKLLLDRVSCRPTHLGGGSRQVERVTSSGEWEKAGRG